MHPPLRQFAECGDLAAKDVEQWRTAGLIQIKHIVAGDCGGIAFAVIKQRPDPGIAVQNIRPPQLFLEVAVHGGNQIVNFRLIRANLFRAPAISHIGGADQSLVALIGVDEDHPFVVVLHEVSLLPGPELRHDDVAAFDQSHVAGRVCARHPRHNIRHPRPRRIGNAARPEAARGAVFGAGFDHPAAILAPRMGAGGPGQNLCAPLCRIQSVQHHQPRIIDPAIGIFKPARVLIKDRGTFRVAPQIQRPRPRQLFPPAKMVVQKQPQPDQPRRTVVGRMRQHKAHRPDDMRGGVEQDLPLDQRLPHQAKFVILQIAQAAMHQLARPRRSALRQIVLFAQHHLQPAPGRIPRNPGPVDAASDHEKIHDIRALQFAHLAPRFSRIAERPAQAGPNA